MGIHDREYYRDDTPSGINLGGDWSITAKLIVINVVVFFADKFTGSEPWIMDLLAASPESLSKPWMCWQLVTYAFAHDAAGYGHIFWNMFGLWIFGRDIEGIYGRKEFLLMYLSAALLGGLVFAARHLAMTDAALWPTVRGASGAVMAVTLLFCLHFPKRTVLFMMVLPMPAWALGAIFIVGNLAGLFNSSEPVAFDVHLVGAAFAICYFKFGWRIGRWVPAWGFRLPKLKRGPQLKLHDPKDSYEELDSEGDRLLQKVSREGMDSLSKAEKRKLEAYSRRMKQKHR